MRWVTYYRHELHHKPEKREAPLWAFFYDVPYGLITCNVFPPLHILNQHLCTGGGDGGMSPGASWQPFELSVEEYAEILPNVLHPDRTLLGKYSRYGILGACFTDSEFDHITRSREWAAAVMRKWGDASRATSASNDG